MIEVKMERPVYLIKGMLVKDETELQSIDKINNELKAIGLSPLSVPAIDKEAAKKASIAYQVLKAHNSGTDDFLQMRFDALASHDITFVNIVQTAIACGLKEFPIPYVLTNCHNSLCAVGGTINEDDHLFGLTAAKKFGGIYVPPHMAVIHQYMRERMCGCGNMILGSDSHTRYGALGVMGIGEGGPELVKQLLKDTYNVKRPEVVAVYLEGMPRKGVGPQDVALALIGGVFKEKLVKNKVLEFVGPGIKHLSVDYRNGIDVMTTETTCLSSIWQTDDKVKAYYETHGIGKRYKELVPGEIACYDGCIKINLGNIEPMLAVPFHPSNVYTIAEFKNNLSSITKEIDEYNAGLMQGLNVQFSLADKVRDGKLMIEQGVVAGCAGGTYENNVIVSQILDVKNALLTDFSLYVYPASLPVYMEMIRRGSAERIIQSGGVIRSAFCGPCFGACDVPSHLGLSVRHTTRNFPNREGSKPSESQISAVFLMDARSVAATAVNNGSLTSAFEIDYSEDIPEYSFNAQVYDKRVYSGFKNPRTETPLHFGPNIRLWPEKPSMPEHLLLYIGSSINDPVTTTDELIPSGETSSFRSDPIKLSTFFLSKRDPQFYNRALDIQKKEEQRKQFQNGHGSMPTEILYILETLLKNNLITAEERETMKRELIFGSALFARKPGDGSAREQAASCQKMLDVWANIARDYATKRYRSNLINWGILPFILAPEIPLLNVGEFVFVPNIKKILEDKKESVDAYRITPAGKEEETKADPGFPSISGPGGDITKLTLGLPGMSDSERTVLLAGNVINFYRNR